MFVLDYRITNSKGFVDLRTLTWDLLWAESSHEIVEIKKMVDLSIASKLKYKLRLRTMEPFRANNNTS